MHQALKDRVAIVTGAGRGIGRATALALAEQGARIIVNDLGGALDGKDPSTAPAETVAAELRSAGFDAQSNADSVSEWKSANRIIESALDHYGRVDVLVNNAGLSASQPIWEHDPELFDRVVRSHLHGTFYCLRAAAPHMKDAGFGRVVNVVSRAGLLGVPDQSAYGAGKGGVFGLTNVASRDLAPFGITVNAVNPAATETRMVTTAIESFRDQGGDAKKMADGLAAALQPPENIAALITAICLDAEAKWNGEIFYLEKDRVGLFDPIAVGQECPREASPENPAESSSDLQTSWTVESVAKAIARFEGHADEVVYRDG